jgi:hypothetical protein
MAIDHSFFRLANRDLLPWPEMRQRQVDSGEMPGEVPSEPARAKSIPLRSEPVRLRETESPRFGTIPHRTLIRLRCSEHVRQRAVPNRSERRSGETTRKLVRNRGSREQNSTRRRCRAARRSHYVGESVAPRQRRSGLREYVGAAGRFAFYRHSVSRALRATAELAEAYRMMA